MAFPLAALSLPFYFSNIRQNMQRVRRCWSIAIVGGKTSSYRFIPASG